MNSFPDFNWSRAFDALTPIEVKLLGKKGASIAAMTKLGLPVPPGFTLTTRAWHSFKKSGQISPDVWQEVVEQIKFLEKKTGKNFADPQNPLVVSVRSGAAYSIPGLMDTIINVGITDKTFNGLCHQVGQASAQDSYQHLKQTFKKLTGQVVPQDPFEQLKKAIREVFKSWDRPEVFIYRQNWGVPHDVGTAVSIQAMVFGNIPRTHSGSGVVFTRDPRTGEKKTLVEFVPNSQGPGIVSGARVPTSTVNFQKLRTKLEDYGQFLEKHFQEPQDIEFTVEKGKLFFLQTRSLKLSPMVSIRVALEMFKEGLFSQSEALRRITQGEISFLLRSEFQPEDLKSSRQTAFFTKGIPASPGAGVGRIALSLKMVNQLKDKTEPVILFTSRIDPNKVDALLKLDGVVTLLGGASSHMAIIIREAGIPGIVGCYKIGLTKDSLRVGRKILKEGDWVSLDGSSGEIFDKIIPRTRKTFLSEEMALFISKRKKVIGESPWATFFYPTEKKYDRTSFLKKIKKVLAETSQKWRSPKAQVVTILNSLLPPDSLIGAVVLKPDDEKGMTRALKEVIQSQWTNIPRTCYYPERLSGAPWCEGPNTEKDIDRFLHDPDYPGQYKGLVEWKKDPTLEGIIIPQEPKGKMKETLAKEHFVFTVSCLDSLPPKVVIELVVGTPHLRSLERVESSDLIQVVKPLDINRSHFLGETNFFFSQKHLDKEKMIKIVSSLGEYRELKQILYWRFGKGKMSEASLLALISEGCFPSNMYSLVVKDQIWQVVQVVMDKVFSEWWQPPLGMPHVMSALDDLTGLSVLEGQGRTKDWCLIYGAKGSEEKEKIAKVKKRR